MECEVARIYDMVEVWTSPARVQFIQKYPFQYTEAWEKKLEFDKALTECVTLGHQVDYKIENFRSKIAIHEAASQMTAAAARAPQPAPAAKEWRYPGFDPNILAFPLNPSLLKAWSLEFNLWIQAGGTNQATGQGNAWLRRAINPELLSKIEENINYNNTVQANLQAIENYIRDTPCIIHHSSDISFTDMIQRINWASK